MNRRHLFKWLRFMHLILDRLLTPVFGYRFRQSYIRMSYRVKALLFPEHDSYIPDLSNIGPNPQNTKWLPPTIPNWVLDEMKNLAREVDPVLYPTDKFLANCRYYSFPILPRSGSIFRKLMSECSSDHYTHCFVIPWLKRGGADLVILKHIEIITKMLYCKVLVIRSEPGDSPWMSRIPAGVDVVDMSRFVGEVAHDELLIVLVRVLVQLRIDTLHIINSRHAWEVVCRYGLAVTQRTRIFASIYCDDFDHDGQPIGFARQYLPECYQRLENVFTDNSVFPELLHKTYGYHPELFRVLKSPIDVTLPMAAIRKPDGRRVLWAGRLDHQKRPDLLLAVALALPDVEFHVYGGVDLDYKTDIVASLGRLKNIRMLGSFEGVESLPFSEFPVFLYTSQWDGMPTMVVAAALASIPIVASRVGGVGDIVTEEQGYPVVDIENVALYVARIIEALDAPILAEAKAAAARKYVENEYTGIAFTRSLIDTPHYMPIGVEEMSDFENSESSCPAA